jgi:Bacterial membrane protein YfhO
MSDPAKPASRWLSPGRFGVMLALMVFASFPQVILGMQTFVARDYGFFAYPLAYFQKECFWHGQIPFWDPYNNCGAPFLAQWNTMPLYPPALIYLLLPLGWSLSFFCLLHLWFGGFGMYFLARKWSGNDFAGAFAGTAFTFSGLTLNLLMWPSHTATWSWMPWVVLAVERAWREGGRAMFMAAICGALQMLAGGPEIIFFTWLVLLALWVQQLIKNDFPRRTFWRFPVMVALVIVLSAAQLLPFLDLVANSQRQAGYADLRWAMPGSGWANFLVPMAFGHRLGEGIFFQDGQYWTSSYYLGFSTLWLALLEIWKVRERRLCLLTAIAGCAIIFALGPHTPVFRALRHLFPQLGFVTYPVKYLLLVTFIAPLLAAFALAHLREQKRQKHIAIIGAVLLLLLMAVLVWEWRSQADDVRLALVNGLERIPFLVLTGAVLLLLARKAKLDFPRTVAAILILVAWLDVLTHEPAQNPTVPPSVYQLGLAREQAAMNPQPELGGSRAMVSPKAYMEFIQMAVRDPKVNFLAKRAGYCADCNLLDAVPKVDGFFSLTTRENNNLFSLIYGATNDFPRLEDFMGVSQITAPDEIYNWQPRKTFLPLVTAGRKPIFLDDANTLQALASDKFDGSKMVFLAPEQKSLVTVTNGTMAQVVSSKIQNNRVEIEVTSPAPSLVVVAQTFYHNWQATVDGQQVPLLRANYGFQAIQVGQGRHEVKLVYRDRAFEIGALFSIVGWLGCLAGLLICRTDRANLR